MPDQNEFDKQKSKAVGAHVDAVDDRIWRALMFANVLHVILSEDRRVLTVCEPDESEHEFLNRVQREKRLPAGPCRIYHLHTKPHLEPGLMMEVTRDDDQ